MPTKTLALLLISLAAAVAAPAASAHISKPTIKGEEVGYFGSATVTRRVAVFVYSEFGPRAGMRVTVCLGGRCERAVGHNAKLAWYSARFTTHGLRMGDPVRFTVIARDRGGRTSVTVRRPLLCMHNNGSTPQG